MDIVKISIVVLEQYFMECFGITCLGATITRYSFAVSLQLDSFLYAKYEVHGKMNATSMTTGFAIYFYA